MSMPDELDRLREENAALKSALAICLRDEAQVRETLTHAQDRGNVFKALLRLWAEIIEYDFELPELRRRTHDALAGGRGGVPE